MLSPRPQRVENEAPPAGEVRVRVQAVGLNFRDVLNVMGEYPGNPGDPGGDYAGVIAAVGPGVTHVVPGDRVYGMADGCLRTYIPTIGHLAQKMPTAWSFEQACTMPTTWSTVWSAFGELAELKSGDRVLIHAATGGVGLVACEYAQQAGAIIYATAGAQRKQDYLRNMNVTNITSTRDSKKFEADMQVMLGGNNLDIVLNSMSHDDYIPKSAALLRAGGIFLEIGKREVWSIDAMAESFPAVLYHIIAIDSRSENDPAWLGAVLVDMTERANRGEVSPLPQTCFELQRQGIEKRNSQITDLLRHEPNN